jgi:hypothetical protein
MTCLSESRSVVPTVIVRCLTAVKPLDDTHAAAAAGARGDQPIAMMVIGSIINVLDIGRDGWRRHGKKVTRCRDTLGLGAAGEEPVMADAVEALRENVDEEAANDGPFPSPGWVVMFRFDDGGAVEVSLREHDYRGPEAINFRPRNTNQLYVI